MAELLPCPICGNIVHITESTVRHYGNRADYEAKIECSCGLTFEKEWIVQITPTNESVLISGVDIETAWNTRTPPTADVAEVKHSRWENISGFDVCNICGTSPAYCEPKPNNKKGYPPYCHNCGAKMDGVRKEEK